MTDTPSNSFPMAPAAFNGNCRTVEAGAGFDWLRQGWAIFVVNPGLWLGAAVIFLLVASIRFIFPLIGSVAANLLTPVLVAGMVYLSRRIANGEEASLDDLFTGLRQNSNHLIMLGVGLMVTLLAISLVTFLISGGSMVSGLLFGATANIGLGLGMALGGWLISWLLSMILIVPIAMALWFAPTLVLFHSLSPRQAVETSFHACAQNWLAFTVLSLMISVLAFFAALPMGLGFLVLVPVLAGAMYASYRDIFVGV